MFETIYLKATKDIVCKDVAFVIKKFYGKKKQKTVVIKKCKKKLSLKRRIGSSQLLSKA